MYIGAYIGEQFTLGDACRLYEKVLLRRGDSTFQFSAKDRSGHVQLTTTGRQYALTCDLQPPAMEDRTYYTAQWTQLRRASALLRPTLDDCKTFQLGAAQMRRAGDLPLELRIEGKNQGYELHATIHGSDQLKVVRAIDKAIGGGLKRFSNL